MANCLQLDLLFRALQISTEEMRVVFKTQIQRSLNDGCSYIALDPANNLPVGFCLSVARLPTENFCPWGKCEISNKIDSIRRFLFQQDLKLFSTEVLRVLEIVFVYVEEKHRRKGIVKQLLESTLNSAKRQGLTKASCVATSLKSQSLLASLHFDTVKVTNYNEFLLDGMPVFLLAAGEDELCAKWMTKDLG